MRREGRDCGDNAPPEHRFKVYISGQKQRVTEAIKRKRDWTTAYRDAFGVG
jgi:hypothetical protein